MNKVILILVDGMRADSLAACGEPYVGELLEKSAYSLNARTVMPSVTLPCHMSLFHSVEPMRHGILTNDYVPQVRPINGLVEVMDKYDKKCAFFYNWEQLRDLSRPGNLDRSDFISGQNHGWEKTNAELTDNAVKYINESNPDFVFLYLGWVDEQGHATGWMGEDYLRAVKESFLSVKKVVESVSDEYAVAVTADHGGHSRSHGTDADTDMVIPVIFHGSEIEHKELENVSIIDIAPTVCSIVGVKPDGDWEGKKLEI